MTSEPVRVFHLPARDVPVPTSISKEAQAVLAVGPVPRLQTPAIDDAAAWHALAATTEEQMRRTLFEAGDPGAEDPEPAALDIEGVRVYDILPEGVPPHDPRVYLDIHGGAWILGGGDLCRAIGHRMAGFIGARTWSVDYRMPPDHPYPAAVDDCLAVYRALLDRHRPEEIIVGGGSAGGNITAALLLRARDEGLPLPAAAVLITPAVDLTASGDTMVTNLGLDTVFPGGLEPTRLLYSGGHDLLHPYLSPLFGDFAKGYPPTILTSGTRDRLLSDTVRMHRALRVAGVAAELHVWEAAGHGMFLGAAPEDTEFCAEIRRFVDKHWARARAQHD
jgi:epsilon-lactone hydrolase